MATMTAPAQRKTSKVKLQSVMLRDSTLEHVSNLAESLGKNSAAGLTSDILEAISEMKPANFHIALAEFVKVGRK